MEIGNESGSGIKWIWKLERCEWKLDKVKVEIVVEVGIRKSENGIRNWNEVEMRMEIGKM